VGGQGCGFATTGQRELNEYGVDNAAGDFAECIAVEEEKRSAAMALEEEVQRLSEGY
jgi:hypothetical protein